jgi:DNA-binding response OmpR family regulator
VLRELKSNRETQDIPVVILSIVDEQKQGFSLGAAEYLVKPIDKHILLRKLHNLERMEKIKRILVVDNETETSRMIGNVLKEAEYQVTTVYNSADALSSVNEFRPDLILLNPMAPEIGFDVMEYLKTHDEVKDIPVIIITQQDLTAEEIDELNGRIQGVLNRGVLSKEDLLKELKNTIAKIDHTQ